MTHEYYKLTPISELPTSHDVYMCVWQKADTCYYIMFDGEWNFDPDMRTPDGWLQPCTLSDLLRERLSEVAKGVWVEDMQKWNEYKADTEGKAYGDGYMEGHYDAMNK